MTDKRTWSLEEMEKVWPSEIVEESETAYNGFAKAESKPLYHNSKVKACVILGGASVFAVLGGLLLSMGKSPEKIVATAPASAPEPTVTNDGWDTAAKQSTAGAGTAINIPTDEAKKTASEDSSVQKSTTPPTGKPPTVATQPAPAVVAAPPAKPPTVVATAPPPPQYQAVAAPPAKTYQPIIAKPIASSQIPAVVPPLIKPPVAPLKTTYQPAPITIPPLAKVGTSDSDKKMMAVLQGLEKKINQIDARVSAVQAQAVSKSAPAVVAQAKPELTKPEKPKPAIQPDPQPQLAWEPTTAQSTLIVDGRAAGKLLDSIKITPGMNGSTNRDSSVVKIRLEQAVKAVNGLEIPPQSIVAMNVNVAANGMISGSSFGVWDSRGQSIDVPVGALTLDSKDGDTPLMAQSIRMSEGDVAAANNEAAVWQAAGAGVDGLTRQDGTTIINGTTIATATTGGNRDFLINALGGLAKYKAKSMEKSAEARQKQAESRTPLWYLAKNTEVSLSVRPPAASRYQNQYQYQQVDNQYQQPPQPIYSPASLPQQYQQVQTTVNDVRQLPQKLTRAVRTYTIPIKY
jgi:hypothetical protein